MGPVFCEFDNFERKISNFRMDFIYNKVMKKRKKKPPVQQPGCYNIRDGFLVIQLDFTKSLKCPCGSYVDGICKHIYIILKKEWKLDDCIIFYINYKDMKQQFSKMIKENETNINYKLNLHLDELFEDLCCSCHDPLNTKLPKLFKCKKCSNRIHTDCMQKWYNAKVDPKTKERNGCPFCREKL